MVPILDWIAYRFLRLTAFIVQRLPLDGALGMGRIFGQMGYLFVRKRAGIAYANLKSAFPESTVRQRKQWIHEMYCHLGMDGVEILRFPVLTREDAENLVSNEGYEQYLEHRWKGKGLILLTAHMGNWELSQIVEAVRKRPITVLARRQKHKQLDRLLNSLRECHGSISVGKGGAIRDLIRALRKGEAVGMLADQSGGDDGVWVRFFGRLTTAPRGPVAMALKWGFIVMPVFMVRRRGPSHHLAFEPPLELVRTGDTEKDLQVNTQNYIHVLESYIRRYPSQWLWGHKRWKRTRTKRILVLSDGKPGHLKQSEALVKEFLQNGALQMPPYEMSVETIDVRFRSVWHKRFFSLFAFFFIPFAQGRLVWLRFFLTAESAQKLERATPDLILSAGASLAPLNLCLARENLAKTVVLMKPSFPYNLFRYDLALVPTHDEGLMPAGHFRIQGALSGVDPETMKVSRHSLVRSLREPAKVRISLFLGGQTRGFKLVLPDVEKLVDEVSRASQELGGDYLVTASRRTSEEINGYLKKRLTRDPRCQLCVIPSEDPRPEVVPGMMALADFLVVTEDSLSMISEALSSGKKVVVVKLGSDGLARKHYRFQEILREKWQVPVVEIEGLCHLLTKGEISPSSDRWEEERVKIRQKVGSLL